MRVSPTSAEFHWMQEHMNMPSQPQQTGVCLALLLGWTPPGCSCQSCFVSVHCAVSAERWREFWEQGSLMQWFGSWTVPIKLMTVCLGRITVNILWFIYCVLHLTAFRSLGHCLHPPLHRANTESWVTPATALYMHPQMICANFCSPMKKKCFFSLIYSITE